MNQKSQIMAPGAVQQQVVPPTHVMVEQIWQALPNMMGQIMQSTQINNHTLEQMMSVMLEHTILIRKLAEGLNIALPSPFEVRRTIAADRIMFLTKALSSPKITDETVKDRIRKEIHELNEQFFSEGQSGTSGEMASETSQGQSGVQESAYGTLPPDGPTDIDLGLGQGPEDTE